MAAELFRVDNRLIHGQVLEAWVPRLRANAIVVADTQASADPFQKSILESMGLGVIDVYVVPAREAARKLAALSSKRVLVLFRSIGEALEAYRGGLLMDSLNLGNIHPCELSRSLTPSVNLTENDIVALKDLMEGGVRIDARAVPTETGPDVACFCRECAIQ